jgi:RHS repeat-associated protein
VVVDGAGALVSRQTYYPFGGVRTTEGSPLPTDYTFTGQKFDASTALMYYGARYYDPLLGRFTQPDTLVPGAANPQNFNRYTYVSNNPVRYTDPTGNKIAECLPGDPGCDQSGNLTPPPAPPPGNDPGTNGCDPSVDPGCNGQPSGGDTGDTSGGGGGGGRQHDGHGIFADDGNPALLTASGSSVSPDPVQPVNRFTVYIPYSWGTSGEAHCDEKTGICAGAPGENKNGIPYTLTVDESEGPYVTRLTFANEEWSEMPGYLMRRQVTIIGPTGYAGPFDLGPPLMSSSGNTSDNITVKSILINQAGPPAASMIDQNTLHITGIAPQDVRVVITIIGGDRFSTAYGLIHLAAYP